jgi:3D (Asp-Asp-Asp) domain-containing protein
MIIWLFPAGYCLSEAVNTVASATTGEAESTSEESDEVIEPSRDAEEEVKPSRVAHPLQPSREFVATAYCLKGRTASGLPTRPGMVAADPKVLPMGTVIHVTAGRYSGTYTVMDTGRLIRGRKIDIYVPSYREALSFGCRRVKVRVVG